MKTLKIEGISQDPVQFGLKTTIVSGGDKYTFFGTKKDGNKTKAYEQFTKFGYKVGDTVDAEVKEEPRSFTNKDGKNVDYVQRTILYFAEVEGTPIVKQGTLEERLSRLEARVKTLENAQGVQDESDFTPDEEPEEPDEINPDDLPF